MTITVTAVPDPPAAADDSYVTPQSMALVQLAPGVLANDSDSGGGALVVDTTPVVAPANGSLSLAADGSFTYTPTLGFTGSDTFTYRVTSVASGLSATGVVTITVSATFSSSLLYLTPNGPTSDLWDMSTSPPIGSPLFVPDYDGDLAEGLTIKSSDGKSTITDPRKSQTWRWPLVSALVLARPGHAPPLVPWVRRRQGLRLPLRLHSAWSVHADLVRHALRQHVERPPVVGSARHLGRHRQSHAAGRTRVASPAARRSR